MLTSLLPLTKIEELKAETLSALKSAVAEDALDVMAMEPPPDLKVETENDFELCRTKREKGKPTGEYEILDPTKTLREIGLSGWEAIFLQPKDENGKQIPSISHVKRSTVYLYIIVWLSQSLGMTHLASFYPYTKLLLQGIFFQLRIPCHHFLTKNLNHQQSIKESERLLQKMTEPFLAVNIKFDYICQSVISKNPNQI